MRLLPPLTATLLGEEELLLYAMMGMLCTDGSFLWIDSSVDYDRVHVRPAGPINQQAAMLPIRCGRRSHDVM